MKQFKRKLSIALALIMTMSLFSGMTAFASEKAYVVSVSVGTNHTVFLMNDGTVRAVGHNARGQLGDNTTSQKLIPITVPGLTDVKAVSTGGSHTVYLMNDGTVKAVGYNAQGQLGIGTTTDQSTPITVPGLADVKAVSAGDSHTVYLMNDGTVKAVGYNAQSQLGDNTSTQKSIPVTVSGLKDVKAISAGGHHTVYLMNDGTVKAVGYNGFGQLGDGTTTKRTSPVTVPELTDVKAVSAGTYHTVYLMNDGTVKTVGSNDYGQLGNGTITRKTTPITVPGLADVKTISAGSNYTVYLMNDGTAKAVGDNSYGQLGDGTATRRSTLVIISGLTDIKAVSAGVYHTIYLMNDGTVKAVGRNYYGQLGIGTTTDQHTPVNVLSFTAREIPQPTESIDVALSDPTRENLDSAWDTVYNLEDPTQKEAFFNQLLDVDLVFKNAHDATQEAVGNTTRDTITDAVDKVKLVSTNNPYRQDYKTVVNGLVADYNGNIGSEAIHSRASYYTERAEKFPTIYYINKAMSSVLLLNESEVKTTLMERVYTVADNLMGNTSFYDVKMATKYVDLAELYGSTALINKAQSLIDDLKESAIKTTLQNRINSL